ncbi:acetyl-CoA carboxylase biotin carboxyl carrier protein [Microscilla marina]|uniref:Biotin carboxyl carrier protein of acetyl-CoA carboxylase n=1 Tax=Microscilla marina ATCC 23134 TaxID=313606 RepID=A1ZN47_MICM2|nr:acetyl-CoA carboxylase biotin carboxyl carrier protein [Microscilla marina]EAY28228.1 acetyl-CoA carboxylase, biotin carboxyl carrier protein [Microscilla marina ATCC 23134]
MKAKEIRDLIDFISKSGLAEVNIESDDFKISIKRNTPVNVTEAPATLVAAPTAVTTPAAQQVVAPENSVATATEAPTSNGNNNAVDESKLITVKSPMIGTFYRSSSPETPPFVNIGDTVETGKTVCIIEAMKLFNEIESDVSGTIVKVLVDNATPVEYDQPLFLVEPN